MSGNPIKKRLFVNIGLISGVLLLVLAVWLSPEKNISVHPLSALETDNITQLRIEYSERPTITINKIDNHWQITEPINVSANHFRLNSILKIAQENSHADFAMSDIDLIELGLDTVVISLFFDTHIIQFGGKNPVSEHRYTRFDDRVHLLDDNYLPLLTQPLASFIDTNILPDHLNMVAYQLADFNISQTATGGWRIEPEEPELSADLLQEWVNRWRSQRTSEVIYDPNMKFDNAPKIIMQFDDDSLSTFRIIHTKEWTGLYWEEQSIGYKLDEETMGLLSGKPKIELPESTTNPEN